MYLHPNNASIEREEKRWVDIHEEICMSKVSLLRIHHLSSDDLLSV